MVILGVDPGSRVTGYGLLSNEGSRLRCLEYGAIRTPDSGDRNAFSRRLHCIHSHLRDLVERYSPAAMAVEDVFYAVNARSALRLGHTRGVVLLIAAQFEVPLIEYSALQVKKAVAGYGRADKVQIQRMVQTLLNLKRLPQPHDAADALAVALCHVFNGSLDQHIQPRSTAPR